MTTVSETLIVFFNAHSSGFELLTAFIAREFELSSNSFQILSIEFELIMSFSESSTILFRGFSYAATMFSLYCKMIGKNFLKHSLQANLSKVNLSKKNIEVCSFLIQISFFSIQTQFKSPFLSF